MMFILMIFAIGMRVIYDRKDNMSYAEDCEDIGGYHADLDFYTGECIDDCGRCDWKYECPNSDYVG